MGLKGTSKHWAELAAGTNSEILSWAERQPWAQAMLACQQDAQWHAEGDVWTHTRLVCAQLERSTEWPTLPRSAQVKLFLAAVFHDAGKPVTSTPDPETGRIRSPKHALAGAGIARSVLRELGCEVLLLGAGDHVELGSAIRSTAALGCSISHAVRASSS